MKVKAWANVLVQSPIDGGQGVGELHVVGQLAQLVNVKDEVGLVSFLSVAIGYKAGFHLQLRMHAVVLLLFCPQIEPAGHGFFQGLLNVAVSQVFVLTWLPTMVTRLPVGKDEYTATQLQGLILQGLLVQTFVCNMQGGDILEIKLIVHTRALSLSWQ